MLLARIERIGQKVAAEVEEEFTGVRVSFWVNESSHSGETEFSIWVSSVSDDREQAFGFAPPTPFYDYDDVRMATELRSKMADYVRRFLRTKRR